MSYFFPQQLAQENNLLFENGLLFEHLKIYRGRQSRHGRMKGVLLQRGLVCSGRKCALIGSP